MAHAAEEPLVQENLERKADSISLSVFVILVYQNSDHHRRSRPQKLQSCSLLASRRLVKYTERELRRRREQREHIPDLDLDGVQWSGWPTKGGCLYICYVPLDYVLASLRHGHSPSPASHRSQPHSLYLEVVRVVTERRRKPIHQKPDALLLPSQQHRQMPSKSSNILSDATNGFRNGLRRVANGQLIERPRAKGKENYPGLLSPIIVNPPTDPHHWNPVDGMIVIKVSIPSTDDIWRFKVHQNISFRAFRAMVELKVGFPVCLVDGPNPQARRIHSDEGFRRWVATRVKNGRNHPITAHKRQLHSLSYPTTPTSPLSPTLPSTPVTPTSPPPPYEDFVRRSLPPF